MYRNFFLCFTTLLLFNNIFAQKGHYILNKLDSLYEKNDYLGVIQLNKLHNFTEVDTISARSNFLIANAFVNLNQEDSALVYYQQALKLYSSLKRNEDEVAVKRDIFEVLKSQNSYSFKHKNYLEDICKYAENENSSKWLSYCYTSTGIEYFRKNKIDSAKYYFFKALDLPKSFDDFYSENDLYSLLGSLYSNKLKSQDSALIFYNKALNIYYRDTIIRKNINKEFNIFNNIGNTYRRSKNYNMALEYYLKAEAISLPKFRKKSKKILYNNMSTTYYYQKNWEQAYNYLYKYDSIKELISLKEQNTTISEIKEQYDNEKLRADNLEIENKRKQNRNLLIAAIAIILFGGSIMLLIQNNTRKKQKLAEQEKALESQKLATVLKEQELVSIDAMIEGQEKERQRIANDLHDDLGGLMATVKLHFNVLKDKKTPELFDKTTTLLDEAYQKIRSIAHAKNSGVIAKQGLLVAVQNMADKISASNKISVDVIDHGLEHRLENSLELTIFRIIQELITNVMKHAEATEATIHLTNHEDILNIMIEDNGKGFNPNQVTTKHKGMGISSIDKRVEHLGGNMTIESEHKKGTTVIIDIPT